MKVKWENWLRALQENVHRCTCCWLVMTLCWLPCGLMCYVLYQVLSVSAF